MDTNEKKKMDANALGSVTGGNDDDFRTFMRCDVCGFETVWQGNYLDGVMYWCPEHTDIFPVHRCPADHPSFHGVERAP